MFRSYMKNPNVIQVNGNYSVIPEDNQCCVVIS